jgi:predicted nucleic acid-binding Zn ribbon protein
VAPRSRHRDDDPDDHVGSDEDDDLDPEGPSAADIARLDRDTARCPACDAEVYDDASVCPICGEILTTPARRIGAIAVAIVALLIVMILIFTAR